MINPTHPRRSAPQAPSLDRDPRRSRRGAATTLTVGLCALSLSVASSAQAAPSQDEPRSGSDAVTVVLSGLTANKATAPGAHGTLLLGVGTPGGAGALQEYTADGDDRGRLRTITSLPASPSDVADAGHGAVWVLFGAPPEDGPPAPGSAARHLYRWTPQRGGSLTDVADLGSYTAAHPDPNDLESDPTDSNPYGLAALTDGSVLVTDAAANAVRQVWPDGRIQTVAQLPVETVSTGPLGAGAGLPPQMPAEAVPTSVAVGPDGAWYVGELKGFPFVPGTSRIWRIEPGSHDITCNPAAAADAACRVSESGFTAVIDITFDRRNRLNVLELAKDGVGAVEHPTGPLPAAALIRVSKGGARTELAPGQLVLPGAVALDRRTGDLFVTDHQLIPGQGRLVRLES